MDIDRIAREIKILKKVRHPYIIQLYQIIETDNELYLVMEHANSGELFDYIVKNGRVDDVTACKFFRYILDGIEYLHYNGVCHRDLKPENMLLEKETDLLKIIDFGLSNLYNNRSDLLETACGSPCYAAPEMIAGKAYKGLEVDIWSCGIILYAMLCGYLPFEDPDTDKLYKKIIKCDYTIPS
jgi:5'-AMP-activated protein kinase catalytic alpha subunit